jgi:hypothetical protein
MHTLMISPMVEQMLMASDDRVLGDRGIAVRLGDAHMAGVTRVLGDRGIAVRLERCSILERHEGSR